MTAPLAAGVGLIVALTASTLVWTVSVHRRDASLADIWWGPGFVVLAWLYYALLDSAGVRSTTVALLVTAWGTRLAVHIARRHGGEDPRYQAMREARGSAFWWQSLFTVFWLQAVLTWLVALPLLWSARADGPASIQVTDAIGLGLFAVGLSFEAIGDWQLMRFKGDPANRGRVLDTGLWRYTRHPNYFGDATLWWGLFLLTAATPGAWLTVGSPLLMTVLLLRVSGVTLLEPRLTATKPAYADYVRRTSAFIPWPPG
jgi:steroid 5-alpha reductase family enzyme